jgi:hypothetical protein
LADLSNVASTTPNPGQGLVWNGSTWAPGSVGYVPGSPPPGGFLGNVFYQDNAGNLTFEDEFRYTASTNTLAVENITGTTVTGTGVVKGSNTFGQRYATQAATNRALANTASLTVERYFTVTAEGNGESFNIQSNTPSAGNKIVRKIWYKNEAFEATDVDTWTLLHTFADDTAYASTATKWQEYLDGQTYGTPPFTLALSWEDVTAFVGLLDTYSGARAAFSVRLLDKDYTGSAIRVRRASDNTEQDIGFTLAGDLDTSALTTFCTGTDGFLRTWYDQSGNGNNLVQTTAANQPKIYDSSTGTITVNSFAGAKFDNSNDAMTVSFTSTSNYSIYHVLKQDVIRTNSDLFSLIDYGTSGSKSGVQVRNSQYYVRIDNTDFGAQDLNQNLIEITHNAGSFVLYKNGSSVRSSSVTLTTADGFTINQLIGNARYVGATWQELIIWPSSQSANRAGIQTNINDYYSIY